MTADTQPRGGVISPANRHAYRILVCLYSWYYFRQMRPALEILARQGHRLHIIAIMHDRDDFQRGCEELCTRYANVTFQVGRSVVMIGRCGLSFYAQPNAFSSLKSLVSTMHAELPIGSVSRVFRSYLTGLCSSGCRPESSP